MNGAEVWERTDKGPEVVRRSEEGAREIKGGYLGSDGRENGYDSGGRSVNSVVELDTLEVGESQASTSGCFENRRRDVSGVVAYDGLLVIRQDTGGVLR